MKIITAAVLFPAFFCLLDHLCAPSIVPAKLAYHFVKTLSEIIIQKC